MSGDDHERAVQDREASRKGDRARARFLRAKDAALDGSENAALRELLVRSVFYAKTGIRALTLTGSALFAEVEAMYVSAGLPPPPAYAARNKDMGLSPQPLPYLQERAWESLKEVESVSPYMAAYMRASGLLYVCIHALRIDPDDELACEVGIAALPFLVAAFERAAEATDAIPDPPRPG